ncbi:MAG: DUF3857 domain-containing protein [Flavobacterium sp.]
MLTRLLFLTVLFFVIPNAFSQKLNLNLNVGSISKDLIENSNAVVRDQSIEIDIKDQRKMVVKTQRIVTILNDRGLRYMYAYESHDKNRKIINIEAKIYNAMGVETKTIKRKDFKDVSVGDGFSIFNDNRAMYLDYTPTSYPFTLVYTSEMQTSNTAFIRRWSPLDGYFVSTENTKITLKYPDNLGFRYHEEQFPADSEFVKNKQNGVLEYQFSNLKAIKSEAESPDFSKLIPEARFALKKFHLEGVDGEANSWEEFGLWYYNALLKGTDELPAETKQKIKALVGNEQDPLEKARIVYNYVQEKTRYVSIQVGIGGWKPMLAKDVDRLGYGDCKALSNYTRALLSEVGVPSYYTIVTAESSDKKDIKEEFVSMQGNHAILAIPYQDDLVWLECTSQTQAFGFQGNFTDDRKVLIVKPEGGQIVRTKKFGEQENKRLITGTLHLLENGSVNSNVVINSTGLIYDNRSRVESLSSDKKQLRYKEMLSHIGNLKINQLNIENKKRDIAMVEQLDVTADGYAKKMGKDLVWVPNFWSNDPSFVPRKYKVREQPFEIVRSETYVDQIEIHLPAGATVSFMPEKSTLNSEFGSYSYEIKKNDSGKWGLHRNFVIKEGFYDATHYEKYRLFMEEVAKNDNAKMILQF